MAIAYLQEFQIRDGDTSTTNYDAVVEELNLTDTPDGLLGEQGAGRAFPGRAARADPRAPRRRGCGTR